MKRWSYGRAAIFVIAAFLLSGATASAHCDSEDGPIIPSLRRALEDGDLTTALKWIAPDDEQEIADLFTRVRALRTQSDEAREIADQFFIESFVRIHRAAEGAPFSGIKPAGSMPPVFAAADNALAQGSVDALADKVANTVRENILRRFNHALELSRHQNESVVAGRAFVEAYVTYVHFVEGLHNYIQQAGAGHHTPSDNGHGH